MQIPVTAEQRLGARREMVQQVKQGLSAKIARERLAVPMHRTTIYRLLKRVQSEGEKALADGRHGHPVKLRGNALVLVREQCQANPCVSSSVVQRLLRERLSLAISVSQTQPGPSQSGINP